MITGLAGKDVVRIACGSTHSAAITADGELYTWGRGNYGRLGHGKQQSLHKMTEGGGRGGWGGSGTPGTEASMAGLAMVSSSLSIK